MKFVAAIKQVPVRDSQLQPAGAWVDESNLSFEINEPDAYALEEALRLREKHGGEVIVLCAGPERATQTIREALAKGADRAIHVLAEGIREPFATARMLCDAIRAEAPELILTGLQSDDLGSGQTGVILAELLGLPHATIVMQVDITGPTLRVKRELEDGWFQHITMPLPAVVTVQSGLNQLRYATLLGIKKAKTKEIRVVKPQEPPAPSQRIERVYLPEKRKQAQILSGDPAAAAAQLVKKLRFEARVL
jgi:electron transfer flavoprotein beta subunit